jgi:transposase InsO family protein
MPWKEVTPMEEINRFVMLAASGRFTLTELCHDFGVSRKTGHKWLRRYEAEGLLGLRPRSRAPGSCPHQTSAKIERWILRVRQQHRTWGPRKLRDLLQCEYGMKQLPSCSTFARILRRHGASHRSRRKPGLYEVDRSALTKAMYPNHVWTVDFKGWVMLSLLQRCDPLTVCDLFSHYVIGCRAQPNQQFGQTLRTFKALMRRHGVPRIIRVDNGTPFASIGLGRLSQLSVWWINQGISVEFTRPAHPQDNGAHERMHKDLKAEALNPPSPTLRAQQRRFERWRHIYNYVRAHEALKMKKPAQMYRRSQRRLRENDSALRYPKGYLVKRLSATGHLWHAGHNYHVGEAFAHCRVGLHIKATGRTELYFANRLLGYLVYDPAEQFRPKAYIALPDHKPLAKTQPKSKSKV